MNSENTVVKFKDLGEATAPKGARPDTETVAILVNALCSWFVRKDSKYFDVENLGVKLSKDDVIQVALNRFAIEFGDLDIDRHILKEVFVQAIQKKHSVLGSTIPVWSGHSVCSAGNPDRLIANRGIVTVNKWQTPAYRSIDVEPDLGLAEGFFTRMFPREAEREMFLNWLTWSLQNEGDKPAWAPFLYSETKGSGKSTLCKLVAKLFGEENSVTQNSVDKLTSRFNMTALQSKLVISEELRIKPGSAAGNTLKTYITETETLAERKGQEAERIRQYCCFLFTSNHLPTWVEPEDRRYYMIEIDHDGHATGARSESFARNIGILHEKMEDPSFLSAVYRALMQRELSDEFNAKTLNVVKDATQLMKRLQGSSKRVVVEMLKETLGVRKLNAIPQQFVAILMKDLGAHVASMKHIMPELGWTPYEVKWDRIEYRRKLWVAPGYHAEDGKLIGPGGVREKIETHLAGQIWGPPKQEDE